MMDFYIMKKLLLKKLLLKELRNETASPGNPYRA